MKDVEISLTELKLIAVTRGMLGAGIGLLLADTLSPERRRTAGWTLLLIGVVSTIPLAASVIGKNHLLDCCRRSSDV